MRKVFCVVLCIALFMSCSKNNESSVSPINSGKEQLSEEFNDVILNITSLNSEFGCDAVSTKSSERYFFKQIADYYAGYWGAKIGTCVGFAAGTYAGSPALGFIAADFCGALGTIAFSVVASAIWDKLCDAAGVEDAQPVPDEILQLQNQSMYIGTPGEAHNYILSNLSNNGKSYLDESNKICVEEMFNDALVIEENLYGGNVERNPEFIAEMKTLCEEFYNVSLQAKEQNLTEYETNNLLIDLLRQKGCTEEEINELIALDEALLPCVSLDDNEVLAYEENFEDIIESSNLEKSKKETLSEAGSIYIHSCTYWY